MPTATASGSSANGVRDTRPRSGTPLATPVVIANRMDDYMKGDIRDGGISGDPIVINGVPLSIREIKMRAQQTRPRAPA